MATPDNGAIVPSPPGSDRTAKELAMSEKIFIEYLRMLRSGTANLNIRDAIAFAAPDRPIAGRYVRASDGRPDNGNGDLSPDELIWQPPRPSTASRKPPARTKGSFRGAMVDPAENRVKVYESYNLERGMAYILAADPTVRYFEDQPPPVTYVTPEGRLHTHTFDFRASLRDGRRIAYALKPEGKVASSGIETTLQLIRQQSLEGFADAALLKTERSVTKRAVHNARAILWARRCRNARDVAVAAEYARSLNGGVRLQHLVDAIGLGPRGRYAVLCLIDEGVLRTADGVWLGIDTLLFPADRTSAVAN